MAIKKIKKDIETKKKTKQKNIKIKENIEDNLKKEYSNKFFINYYNENFYEIFDKYYKYNETLNYINEITKNKSLLSLYNICFYKINNLPYCQLVYYFIYKLYNEKINLVPEVHQNFIYNYNNNIIEINFDKYILQSFNIINDFLKPKILDLFNYEINTIEKVSKNNNDNIFNKILIKNNSNNDNNDNNNSNDKPYIFILHNINRLSNNTLALLLNLIKISYSKTNLIRFIISSNTQLKNSHISILSSININCISMKEQFYQQIYDYIYYNNYIKMKSNISSNISVQTYNDNENINTKHKDYLSYKNYIEIYPYYKVNNVNNILIYLLNIDSIYLYKNKSVYKEEEFNDKTIEYLKNKINQIPLFENNLYQLLNTIIFNSKSLINIIDDIKSYINNIINYDVDFYLYIKILINYFNIIVKNIDKKIYIKQYKELLNIYPFIIKIIKEYEMVQLKSKFINDFIVYEQVLLSIYKLFYKYNFYRLKNNDFNSQTINNILNNNIITNIVYPIQLND
jgi:hypothetical protein